MSRPVRARRLTDDEGQFLLRLIRRRGRADAIRYRRGLIILAASSGTPVLAIARLVAADLEAERPWFATQYVPGPSLHDKVAEDGPLSAAEVAAIGAALSEGLVAVHEAGVSQSHDVSPYRAQSSRSSRSAQAHLSVTASLRRSPCRCRT